MPTDGEHITLALHNIEVGAAVLKEPNHSDWAATVLFYASLHVVEAVFYRSCSRFHGGNHERRERSLKQKNQFTSLYKHYHPLWTASAIARYLQTPNSNGATVLFATYMPPEKLKEQLVKTDFAGVLKAADKFLHADHAKALHDAYKTHIAPLVA
jgi:hypothetical protein